MVAKSKATKSDARQADEDLSDLALEQIFGYNLKRAYIIVQNDFREALGEGGMSPRVFSALSLVAQIPNITQSELARKLAIERSGLVAIIDQLEESGFLRRMPVPGDRRVQALAATPEGISAWKRANDLVRQHEQALLSVLTEDEKEALITILRKIRFAKKDKT